jgi:hypothetical protein
MKLLSAIICIVDGFCLAKIAIDRNVWYLGIPSLMFFLIAAYLGKLFDKQQMFHQPKAPHLKINSMDKFTIKEYNQRFWNVAEVFKNGSKIADINRFYDVTVDWIIIYNTVGGSGTGWRKGEVLKKIFIGNSEFSREYC